MYSKDVSIGVLVEEEAQYAHSYLPQGWICFTLFFFSSFIFENYFIFQIKKQKMSFFLSSKK